MGHFDTRHTAKAVRMARKDYPKSERTRMGAAIVRVWHDFMRDWDRPYARLFCGGITSSFWVVKEADGYRKGQRVLSPEEAHGIIERGGRLRPIRTPRNRALRGALSEMAQAMTVHHAVQFGFVTGRSCVDGARLHAGAKTVLTLDVSDAFGQVTQADVEYLLHALYDVNHKEAALIAAVSCWGHRLYQGSPIAPQLWNARMYAVATRLDALCRANGLTVSIYADDIAISSATWEYFSKRFIRTVIKILREEGIRVNPRKTHVTHPKPSTVGATAITGLTIDYDEDGAAFVRPLHRGRMEKKARYLARLLERGVKLSRESRKDGGRKYLDAVVSGIANWCRVAARAPSGRETHTQLSLCKVA